MHGDRTWSGELNRMEVSDRFWAAGPDTGSRDVRVEGQPFPSARHGPEAMQVERDGLGFSRRNVPDTERNPKFMKRSFRCA